MAGLRDPYWPLVQGLFQPEAGATIGNYTSDETGKTLSYSGDASFSNSNSIFTPGAKLVMDGTGDYATWQASAGTGFGSNDFTVEVNFATTAASTWQGIVGLFSANTLNLGWRLYTYTDGNIWFDIGNSGGVDSVTIPYSSGALYYLHAYRSGSTMGISLDGGTASTTSTSRTITDASDLLIGRTYNNGGFTTATLAGEVWSCRITNGVARPAIVPTDKWPRR